MSFLTDRIFKDEFWRPDFCDFAWEEAVQVDVILQVLNRIDWTFWFNLIVWELIQWTKERILFHPSLVQWYLYARIPEISDVTQTISWWGKIELGRIHPPRNDLKKVPMCSYLVDIHDTLDPHTDSHLTKIHSSNYLKSIPLRFKLLCVLCQKTDVSYPLEVSNLATAIRQDKWTK